MMELFHNAALKPRVHHWGTGATEMAWSIDINSCRRNALLMAPLPSFDFTDEPETYDPQRFKDYDFYWVDNGHDLEMEGCPCGTRRRCERMGTGLPFRRLHALPYQRAGLYPRSP